jgi:hypothetical protein
MAVDFNPERGELNCQASYSAPMFALWKSPGELFQLLFGALSKYGLHLNDLKWGPSSGVGDAQLNFFLFNYAATVRVKMDRVEIEVLDVFRVDEQQLQDAAAGLIGALKTHSSDLSVAAYVVTLAYHGKLASGTAKDFTRALTAAPPDAPGPSAGAGVVFYYGPNEERVSSAVTIDLSGLVQDALFFRVHMVWDASRIKVEDLGARTRQYTERVFGGFGLTPVAGK